MHLKFCRKQFYIGESSWTGQCSGELNGISIFPIQPEAIEKHDQENNRSNTYGMYKNCKGMHEENLNMRILSGNKIIKAVTHRLPLHSSSVLLTEAFSKLPSSLQTQFTDIAP